MNEQENIRLVQQAYDNFKRGDISALLASFSEDIDWDFPEIENVPFAGRRRGHEGAQQFFRSLAESQEVLAFEPQEFFADGDKVVVLGCDTWRVRENGREFRSDWTHAFTIQNGKIAKFKEYMDTAATMTAHQKAQAA